MESNETSTPKGEFTYFDAQAYWGVTKHIGGLDATDELANLCHIDKGKRVLEVGCGTGVTACHLARRYGCKIIGVDISEKMVDWSGKRARRKSLAHMIKFSVVDAQNLPFDDNLFDAVISESVTAFPQNKPRVISEYVRVVKPGGYVGINEGTWVKENPPPELVEYVERTMAKAAFLSAEGWKALLEDASLTDIVVRTCKINAFSQRLNELKGLDCQDRLDRLRGLKEFIVLYLRNSKFREYAREIMPSKKIIKNLFTYLGYGIYIGKKAY